MLSKVSKMIKVEEEPVRKKGRIRPVAVGPT